MSIFQPGSIACPNCGHTNTYDTVYSVNADLRPDLRDAILDNSFQRADCEACGTEFRVDPELSYVCVEDGQWVLAEAAANFARWTELESQAQSTFATAYGDGAPAAARAIGSALKPRVVFGWAALCEKLLAARHGLDDVTLEVLKLALMRGPAGEHLADDTELRLVGVDGDALLLAWLKSANGELVEGLTVPRDAYDGIAAAAKEFAKLRAALSAGPFVDLNRLLVEVETPA